MRDLLKALVSGVVLGIPFIATWWVPVFLVYWADQKLAKTGRPSSKLSPTVQVFLVVWIFAGVGVALKVVEAISAATGIK